jgi:hypothetical protein
VSRLAGRTSAVTRLNTPSVSEAIAGQRAGTGDAVGTALKSRTEHSVEDT